MQKSNRGKHKRPMDGVLVVELASHAFVPGCCACLADWGARVIKLEQHPFGDPSRAVISSGLIPLMDVNYYWEWCNRGKESICVDLKTDGAREIAYELVKKADIFATNLRLGSLKRIKMDPRSLFQLNPKLVIARATGFGDKGPGSGNPGFDIAAFWARSGIAHTLSDPSGPILNQPPAFGDFISGMYLAGGVAAGLAARERTGKGQEVSLSLLAAGLYSCALSGQFTLASGKEAAKIPRDRTPNPLWNSYRTRDGRWVQMAMLQSDPYWHDFCTAIGRPDLIEDPKFASHAQRSENNVALITILDKVFASKSYDEWRRALPGDKIIWAPFQNMRDVFNDVQVLENEYITAASGPEFKMNKFVASPVQFNGQPNTVKRPAPALGQHTEEILLELGWDWKSISDFKESGAII